MATAQLGTLLRHIHTMAAGPSASLRTDRQLLDDFAARGDESAFTALVARHGPMVLRAVRRVLRHEQDAEDAFQATFLVLARSAGSIRRREAVASWLHGVAYRTAMKARRGAARRRGHEARLRGRVPEAAPGPSWDEVQGVLDEEVRRLPEPFRAAFTLCVLEGKSGPEAAAELGVKEGTVASRLGRARQQLRQRLARRGIKLSALLAALTVAEGAGRAAVPARLAEATVRSGLLVAVGGPTARDIPSHVAALAAQVTGAMLRKKARIATVVLLAAGLLAAGAGALTHQALAARGPKGPPPATPQPASKEAAKPAGPGEKDALVYAGRVLGPGGRPVAGARLYLTGIPLQAPPSESATTGDNGRFRFTVPKAKVGDYWTVVTATAAGHGPGWVEVLAGARREGLSLRLVKDDVPITGQIVDLEGKPVPGATLRVQRIEAAPGEDLGPWIEAVQHKQGPSWKLDTQYLGRSTGALTPQVTTDAAGRFRLTGIGRERLVTAQLEGPGLAVQELHILTRPGKPLRIVDNEDTPRLRRSTTYYGADFRHVAAPTKPVVGVVRDKDTKKPLAGITVQSYKLANNPVPGMKVAVAVTDAFGRYRLTGLPKGEGNKIVAVPGQDRPYPVSFRDVPDSPVLAPVTVDIELKRGVWVEGRVTDKITGKPAQASLEYFALSSNPNLRDYPGFGGDGRGAAAGYFNVTTKADGSYRVVGLPGPGLIAVFYTGRHLLAPERDDEYGAKAPFLGTAPYQLAPLVNYTAIARVNPERGAGSVRRDVTLDPGWTFTGTVLGPDGKPLAGARAFGLSQRDAAWDYAKLNSAEFTVRGFNPRRPRDMLFLYPEKGLVGVAQPPKGPGGAVAVQLGPGGTVTGRAVDAQGKPRAGLPLGVSFRPLERRAPWGPYPHARLETDREGRFRVEGLLPGCEFRLTDGRGEVPLGGSLGPGQTKDLGDVVFKPAE
jgi:RNA polymerase sigma factor (sigma-70 family)